MKQFVQLESYKHELVNYNTMTSHMHKKINVLYFDLFNNNNQYRLQSPPTSGPYH